MSLRSSPPSAPSPSPLATVSSRQLVKAPVYQQLNELLRALIRSGEIKSGERFLTERQIAERFEVSRATANKALSNLVSEGVLAFRKGVGTFVAASSLDVDLRMLVSFTARAEGAGMRPSTRVLVFRRRAARELDAKVALHLALSPEAPIFELERLRLADEKPVIHEHRWINAQFVPGLDARMASGSLYGLFTERFQLRITGADQHIRAVSVDAKRAQALAWKKGAAALEIEATGYLDSGQPLWHEITLYRGDTYAFRNRLGVVPADTNPGPSAGLQIIPGTPR